MQPATRKRYDQATNRFLAFLEQEGHVLPKEKHKMGPLVSLRLRGALMEHRGWRGSSS